MSRAVRWGLAIIAAQAALFGIYRVVEARRTPKTIEALGTEPPVRTELPIPSLHVRRRDGSRLELSLTPRRRLVHVWATWCPPCRDELPGLLALADAHKVEVVAIALDRSWADVDRFLAGRDSANVVLAASDDVAQSLEVRELPVTFLQEAGGQLALRFEGARDWTDEGFVQTYVEVPRNQ